MSIAPGVEVPYRRCKPYGIVIGVFWGELWLFLCSVWFCCYYELKHVLSVAWWLYRGVISREPTGAFTRMVLGVARGRSDALFLWVFFQCFFLLFF